MSVTPSTIAGVVLVLGWGLLATDPAAGQSKQAEPAAIYLAGNLRIVDATLAAPAADATSAEAFVTIENRGPGPEWLLGAQFAAADATTTASAANGGDGRLELPAGKSLVMQADGAHFVLDGLHGPLNPGDTAVGTVRFERAGPVAITFTVRAP